MAELSWLIDLLGRLHPLLVHFPIGLLVMAALMECWEWKQGGTRLRPGIDALLYAGAVGALLSVGSGLLLAGSGEYDTAAIALHRNLGILTTLLAGLAALLLWKAAPRKWLRTSMLAMLASLSLAGHLGAEITHGAGFLTTGWGSTAAPPAADPQLLQLVQQRDSLSQAELDRLNLEVRAIFAHSCYRCHSQEKHKGGLVLQSRDALMKGGDSGPVIVPGKPGQSELMRRIRLPKSHEEVMPNKGKLLTQPEIALIESWIKWGAHWADSTAKTFREAPLALTAPDLPAAPGFTHPIDRILNVYFEAQGIAWPRLVDDRTFMRRAWLDVLGLLPPPEAVQEFVQNTQPNKRETLVDELLARRHDYAQHWMSFWNDLLRNDYSGTGFITGGRRQISAWLYEALYHNHSYNQMVRELIDPSEASQGFIQGIRWRGAVNASQRTEMQAAQNISQSLLGLNLKCASCHDSFVSNLTLEQAYNFANIFADSTLEIHRCDQATGRMATPRFLYPELGQVEATAVKERLQQLATVVVQPANGRLYRTLVNRYWAIFMGRGLVHPVDEMDQLPWSQPLLDWLAADFRAQDADLQHLIRQILTSRAYQLPAVAYGSIEQVRSQAFVFRGPLRRRLSAEQFADALSQLCGPLYHAVAFDPTHAPQPAEWIWKREQEVDRDILPRPGKRFFRHAFELADTAGLRAASLWLSVDHAFQLYLNGQEVGSGKDWRYIFHKEVKPFLKPGRNLIAIAGTNEGQIPNPAGVLFELRLLLADSSVMEICSNTEWKCTADPPAAEWMQPDFDDSQWEQARRQRRSHWGILLGFGGDSLQHIMPFARASLTYLDAFQKALGRPTRENVATSRDDRTTLLQALELTNGAFFNEALLRGAQRWMNLYPQDPQTLTTELYQHALLRPPSKRELRTALDLLGSQPGQAEVADLLWSLVLLPEFQIIY